MSEWPPLTGVRRTGPHPEATILARSRLWWAGLAYELSEADTKIVFAIAVVIAFLFVQR